MGLWCVSRVATSLLLLATLCACSSADDTPQDQIRAGSSADDGGAAGDGSSGAGGARAGGAGAGGGGNGSMSGGGAGDAGASEDAGNDAAIDAGTDSGQDAGPGDIECPSAEPTASQACTGQGVCTYGASPGCRTVWECFGGKFVSVHDDACVGPSLDQCPLDPEQPGDACPNQLTHTCVYEDGSICSCQPPFACSGVAPDPDSYVFRCSPPPRAGCSGGVPAQRAACPELGLTCGSSCCGPQWTCTESGWDVKNLVCPP
jgi:hypothetical protein